MPEYPQTILDDIAKLQQQVRELLTTVASIPSDATSSPWLAAASLGSGWTDMNATDSDFDLIGARAEPGGIVRLRGAVMRSGSAWPASGFTLLTLPSTLLPISQQAFVTAAPYSGGGRVVGEFLPSGAVIIVGWGGGTAGNAGSAVGLDGLTYRIY